MTFSDAARKPARLSDSQQANRDTGKILSRKLWLPKVLYNALPYFYLFAGLTALFATLYISSWFWLLPYYLLFSAACLHMGILIYRRRHKDNEDSEQR